MGLFNFFKRTHRDPRKELVDLLEGYELPSFPVAVMKVLDMLRDPDSPMSQISAFIQADPGMHVMVLKTVNSAAFGLCKSISNVHHATTLLGRARLETLILPLAVKQTMKSKDHHCFDSCRFWLASSKRGCLAALLAAKLNPGTRMEAFTGGLLQDMAIPVISSIKKETYCALVDQWNKDENTNLKNLEIEAMGFDHQAIGGLMAEEWGFPEFLINSVSKHHEDIEDNDMLIGVKLASNLRYCNETNEKNQQIYISNLVCEKTSLEESEVEPLVEQAFKDALEFSLIFN